VFLSGLFNYAVNCKDHVVSAIDEWMSVEHWQNGNDGEKPNYPEKNLSQCHFISTTNPT
jgi:hypothetical protein